MLLALVDLMCGSQEWRNWNNKPKTSSCSTCGMLLLAITKGCEGLIGLLSGFWKMMNTVFRVEMRKPRVESQEWILCSAYLNYQITSKWQMIQIILYAPLYLAWKLHLLIWFSLYVYSPKIDAPTWRNCWFDKSLSFETARHSKCLWNDTYITPDTHVTLGSNYRPTKNVNFQILITWHDFQYVGI